MAPQTFCGSKASLNLTCPNTTFSQLFSPLSQHCAIHGICEGGKHTEEEEEEKDVTAQQQAVPLLHCLFCRFS